MQESYHLYLFYLFLAVVFGYMQWYILRNYFHWLRRITSKKNFNRYRYMGIAFFVVFNVIFLMRFPSTNLGWYQNPLYQSLIIYPGGMFFGMVCIIFTILLIVRSAHRLVTFIDTFPFRKMLHRFQSGISSAFGIFSGSDSSQDTKIPSLAGPTDEQETVAGPEQAAGFPDPTESTLISRRQFLRTTGTAVIATPAVFIIGASAATSHDYQIIHQKLYYPGLPSSLNGLKIAQLSDIHSGIYMTESQMEDIFELTNEQHPDIVTLTGDFVDNSVSEIPALYRAISRLKSEYGIFGCLGNHDHYASSSAVSSALLQRKIRMLNNEHQTLTINGEPLTIIGVDDAGNGPRNFARLDQALYNMPSDSFQVLLSHRPDMYDNAREEGIDLTLSGHTHGGQIGFDFMGIPVYPIHLFQKYAKGLYENNGQKLYVNVGIGMVGVPVRLVRPELTIIELTNIA